MSISRGKAISIVALITGIGYAFVKGNQSADTASKLDFKLAGLRLKNLLNISPTLEFDLEIQNASATEAEIEINDVNLIVSGKKIINGDAQNKKVAIAPKSKSKISNIIARVGYAEVFASVANFLKESKPIIGELEVVGSFNGIVFTQKLPFKHQQA